MRSNYFYFKDSENKEVICLYKLLNAYLSSSYYIIVKYGDYSTSVQFKNEQLQLKAYDELLSALKVKKD